VGVVQQVEILRLKRDEWKKERVTGGKNSVNETLGSLTPTSPTS